MSAIIAFLKVSRSQSAIVAFPLCVSALSASVEAVAYATMPRISLGLANGAGLPVDPPPSHASDVTSFPEPDTALTHILIVSDVARSRAWYTEVLGATLYREYGGTSVVLSFAGRLLLADRGPPPMTSPGSPRRPPTRDRDNLFTIRVTDCEADVRPASRARREFLTPPVAHGAETRSFFRDPDGHLFEISEYRPG